MNKYLLLVFFFMTFSGFAQTNVHRVIRGETIYTIARLYGTTAARIADINNLDVANIRLSLGQKLIIPNKYYELKKTKEEPKYKSYVIKQGDSYYSIARSHDLSVYDVVKINKLKGNTAPIVGSTILIPVKENETQQISMQEVKMNVQQGDAKERVILDEIAMEAMEYYFVKNSPYKRPKLIADFKELPIQIFYRAEIKIDTGKVKKSRKSKKESTDAISSEELHKTNMSKSLGDKTSVPDSMKLFDSASLSNGVSAEMLSTNDNNYDMAYGSEVIKITELISADTANAEWYFQRAKLYYKLNQYDSSMLDIDKSIALSPDSPAYYLLRANISAKTNEYKKAIEDYVKAEEKGIDKREVFMRMAMMYEREGDYLMAVIYYDREIEANPQNGMAFYLKALALKQTNQSDQACNSLKKAVALEIEAAQEAMKNWGCAE